MFGFLENTRDVEEDVQGELIERVHTTAEEFLAAVPDSKALDYSRASVLDAMLGQAREGGFFRLPVCDQTGPASIE